MKFGFVGSGSIAKKMAQTFQNVEKAEIIAIASTNPKTMGELSEEYNIPDCYDSYEEMLKSDNVEVVYIATPHSFHFDQAMQALENGKHVFCEKPIAISKELVEKLFIKAKEKKLFIGEAFWTRFNPLALKMQKEIKEQRFGRVISLMSDYGGNGLHSP